MMQPRSTLLALALSLFALGAPAGAQAEPAGSALAASSTPGAPGGAEQARERTLVLPLMLRMLDGSIHFGSVVDHSPAQVTFERLDTGGIARIPWRLLDPVQSEELQTRFGYVDRSGEEVLVDADRLLVGGEELIGKIVSRSGDDLVVKTASRLVFVPKLRLQAAPTQVQVPALDIYTKDELYAQELARSAPETAGEHVALAQFCERILALDRALEHWQLAQQAADAGRIGDRPLEVDLAVARSLAEDKAAAQAELDHLQQIDSLRARKRYDEALALSEEFVTLFPDTRLLPDLKKKRERVERAREEALGAEVERSWHRWVGKLARQAARTLSYGEVQAYLDGGLRDDIEERVLHDVRKSLGESIELEEVRRAWAERKPGRWHKASYGFGTWLLGEARAHAGLHGDQEPREDAGTTPRTSEEQALADKIKRYLENQKAARAKRASTGDADEQAAFWDAFALNAKEFWIRAYYAEHSGDMELRGPTAQACPACGGTGVREIAYTGAGGTGRSEGGGSRSQRVACPTCHYMGIVRRVTYR